MCFFTKKDFHLGSFDEAVNAEKLFSEYFNTTDAEAEMNPSVPQRSKKTKKSKAKASYASESEDESPGELGFKVISFELSLIEICHS